jgi:hypothetical protein
MILFHDPRYEHTAVPQRAHSDMKGTSIVTDEPSTWFGLVALKQLLLLSFLYTQRLCNSFRLYFIRNVYGLHVNK